MTAEYQVGHVHYNGMGTPIDYVKARHWYHKAAVQASGCTWLVCARVNPSWPRPRDPARAYTTAMPLCVPGHAFQTRWCPLRTRRCLALSRLGSPCLALSGYSQHSYWLSLCTRGFVLPRPAMPRARFQRRRSSKYDRLGGRENVVPPGTVCACDCRATRTPSTTWRRCTALARAGPSTSWRPSSGIDFAPSRAALGPCTSTREPVNMAAPSLP